MNTSDTYLNPFLKRADTITNIDDSNYNIQNIFRVNVFKEIDDNYNMQNIFRVNVFKEIDELLKSENINNNNNNDIDTSNTEIKEQSTSNNITKCDEYKEEDQELLIFTELKECIAECDEKVVDVSKPF